MSGMQRGALFSGIFHLTVILLAWFGLPRMIVTPPEPEKPIIIELAQIGDITNPPPAPQIQPAPDPEPAKPEPPKPEPPKPEPQKAPPPPPPPPPKPAEPAPPPEPAPKPKEKAPEPKPEAPKSSPLAEVKPKTKPEPPAEDFIKNVLKSVDKPKPQQQSDEFDKMLKKMADSAPKKDEKPQPQAQPAKQAPAGSPISSMNQQYTITEQDFIRAYIEKNWSPPVGAKEVIIVIVSFTLRPDGSITDVRYENQRSDTLWQSFADSARRAILLSSPIPIPQKTGRTEERIVMTFNPALMMGYSKPR